MLQMDSVPNHDFMELHTIHQHHQPQYKRQCFVFSEIPDIELPPEIKQFSSSSEKSKNDNFNTFSNKDGISSMPQENSSGGKVVFVFGTIFVCIALAGGIPLALQLRSSSLLEARLNFIKRLLSESPLIGYWNPRMDKNFSSSIMEIKTNLIGAILWPVNVPCKAQYLDAVQLALEGIDKAQRVIVKSKELKIVENTEELKEVHGKRQVAVILGLDGGHTIGASLAVLRSMYTLGTRFVSITSTECTTPWAQAAPSIDQLGQPNFTNALSNFGQTVVHEMNRLGMLVEISRLSEAAMLVAIKTTRAPVLITNAVPMSLCNHSGLATIPDRVLSLLPDNGGVFMINTEKCNEKKLSVKDAIHVINYVRRIAGVNHIGLSGVPNSYPFLLAELARDRIWGNSAIKKLIGGNIIRVLKEVEVVKNRLPISEEWIPHDEIKNHLRCKYPET